MRAYGAEIVLTPGNLGTDGAIEEAYRLAREEPETYVLMDQFNNPASIEAHYAATAVEIYEDTGGRVTHGVCRTFVCPGRWPYPPAIPIVPQGGRGKRGHRSRRRH